MCEVLGIKQKLFMCKACASDFWGILAIPSILVSGEETSMVGEGRHREKLLIPTIENYHRDLP